VVDVARWAKRRFRTPLFISGGSLGGALSYYAASAGAPADAVACLNLFDFGNGFDGIAISRMAPLAKSPAIVRLMKAGIALLKPFHSLRIPFNWLGAFNHLMDERDAVFQAQWNADPIPPRLASLRSLTSNMSTSPAVPFENNRVPVLVINQGLDRMVSPSVTRSNYERLGGPKRYLEVSFGHWSSQPEFWETIVQAADEWFKEHSEKREPAQMLDASSAEPTWQGIMSTPAQRKTGLDENRAATQMEAEHLLEDESDCPDHPKDVSSAALSENRRLTDGDTTGGGPEAFLADDRGRNPPAQRR
jgi:hypothetical protein